MENRAPRDLDHQSSPHRCSTSRQTERASTLAVHSGDGNSVVAIAGPVFNFEHGGVRWYMGFVPSGLHRGFPVFYWVDDEASERQEDDTQIVVRIQHCSSPA
jgi:hypothetical protein